MKRSAQEAAYRTYPHRHGMNRGKEAKVRAMLAVWRRVAQREARVQWRHFFESGALQHTSPARFGEFVTARQHQMIRDQVIGQIEGWLDQRQDEFTRLVARSKLPESLRHQLHHINRWQAWFSRQPLSMKGGSEVPEEARRLARVLMRRVMERHRRPRYGQLEMRLDARGVEIQEAEIASAFPLWLRLMTLTPRERILVPLRPNRYAADQQGELRKMVRVHEAKDGSLTFALVRDHGAEFKAQREAYRPECEEVALDFGLSTLFATDRGDLLGRDFLARLRRYDRRITSRAAHLQRMGRRPSSSEKYRRDVERMRGFIRSEVNRVLNRIVERDRPGRLVLERLDFRSPELSRRMNRLVQNCGRRVVEEKLKDLEEKFGVTHQIVASAYTSQECSACGYVDARNRRSQSRFRCLWCGRTLHADVNAGRVIKQRRSLSIGLSYATKAEILQARVRPFLERWPRLRPVRPGHEGKPADPRLSNPYFADWAAQVT